MNVPPPLEAISALQSDVAKLDNALEDIHGIDEQNVQKEYSLCLKAAAANAILQLEAAVLDVELIRFSSALLIEAAAGNRPQCNSESNDQFDRSPMWGSEVSRSEAAIGLMRLVRLETGYSSEIRDAINDLSKDPCNSVRSLIVEKIGQLEQHDPQLMWAIVIEVVGNDKSHSVCWKLVLGFLRPRLMEGDTDQVLGHTLSLFNRFPGRENTESVQEVCLSLFLEAYLQGFATANGIINDIVRSVEIFAPECEQLVINSLHRLRNDTTVSPEKRERVWRILNQILSSTAEPWHHLRETYGAIAAEKIPDDALAKYTSLGRILVSAMEWIYLSSGAIDHHEFSTKPGSAGSMPNKMQFWHEVQASLEILQHVGVPLVVQKAVETLSYFIDVDPTDVFHRLAKFVLSGSPFGYQRESIACETIVKVIERYLAEHREIFKGDGDCLRSLMQVLSFFVGWPEANRLTYRLDEIYR